MINSANGGAAILAGGQSRRMGQNKALLVLDGITLLERCADALRPLASRILVIADSLDRYSVKGCDVVGDLYPGAGPVGGIVTALLALGEGPNLVVACDMPFLRTALLQMLREAATDDFDAVVPWIGGRPEPLCAVYRHTCIEPFQQFMRAGQRAAHRAVDTIRTLRMDESNLRRVDPELVSFINVNTPEDADRWLGKL